MLTHSVIENPVLVGSSVHNVRIKRLWRDTFRCVLSLFYQLFYHLERVGKLNLLSQVDLFCLQYVYIPRINSALEMFQVGWNNHAITTEHCQTPMQLFVSGNLTTGRPLLESTNSSTNKQLPVDVCSGVVVPVINCPLNAQKEAQLRNLIPYMID